MLPFNNTFVAAGGGSPTNVQRFASGELATGLGTTADYVVGTVAVGDLLVLITWVLNAGSLANLASIVDLSLGNTITARQTVTDGVYGFFIVHEIIVTVAGSMTLRMTAPAINNNIHLVGEQWNGVTYTYDQSAQVNGTDVGFAQINMPALTFVGNDRLAFFFAGGGGVNPNVPTVPGGFGSVVGSSASDQGTLIMDAQVTSAQSPVAPVVPYTGFCYGMAANLAYTFV